MSKSAKLRPRFYLWLYKFARSKHRRHLTKLFVNELTMTYSNGLKVSDHAIVRFIDRIEGRDIKRIANEITGGLKERVMKDGDGKYINGRMRVVVVGKWVKTVDGDINPTNYKSNIVSNPIRGLPQPSVADVCTHCISKKATTP